MAILVIDQQTDLAALTRRLLKPRTPAVVAQHAIDAILAANPGIDADRLDAGSVIVLPDLPHLREPEGRLREEAGERLIADVLRALDASVAAMDAALAADRTERERVGGLVSAHEVTQAADRDTVLRQVLTDLRAALDSDEQVARKQAETVRDSAGSWRAELQALRALVRPADR